MAGGGWLLRRLVDCEPGSPENENFKAWLEANEIPVADTPWSAVFYVPSKVAPNAVIQIDQFDRFAVKPGADPLKFVSMHGGFAKRERIFPLLATLEQFNVKTETVPYGTCTSILHEIPSEPAEDVA